MLPAASFLMAHLGGSPTSGFSERNAGWREPPSPDAPRSREYPGSANTVADLYCSPDGIIIRATAYRAADCLLIACGVTELRVGALFIQGNPMATGSRRHLASSFKRQADKKPGVPELAWLSAMLLKGMQV